MGTLAVLVIGGWYFGHRHARAIDQALADFLQEGTEIFFRDVTSQLLYDEWKTDMARWYNHTRAYLTNHLGTLNRDKVYRFGIRT
jgi:DNA-binding transcriptional MocR family regulator